MDLLTSARRKLFSWLLLGAMALLVGVLAVLQYNWIGEVSHVEQKSLAEKLRLDLDSIRRDFDREIGGQVSALIPSEGEIADSDLATAYGRRYHGFPSGQHNVTAGRRALRLQ